MDLFGQTTDTSYNTSNGYSGNFAVATSLQATAAGRANFIRVKALGVGSVRAGIYADSAGSIGALLNQTSSVPVVAGLNYISLPQTNIVSGTTYWLALCSNADVVIGGSQSGTSFYWATIGNAFGTPASNSITTTIAAAVMVRTVATTSPAGINNARLINLLN